MGDKILVNDEPEAIDLDRALDEVSPERRAYALGYRHERDRRLSVAVYLLLKEALWREYGIVENPRLARGPNGKPFLPDHPEIHFNFSHCPKAAACIVSDRLVGIDVEEIAPVDWDVARRVLSDDELADVRASAEPDVAFARYWTRKEAFVKMKGIGLGDLEDLGGLDVWKFGRFGIPTTNNQQLTTSNQQSSTLYPQSSILSNSGCRFETRVNRARGYVLTTASQEDGIMISEE